jgi:hypothetical protein
MSYGWKKQIIALGVFVLLSLFFGQARAEVVETLSQNTFATAESLDPGLTQAGVHFTIGEGYQSYYPTFRFGLGGLVELGVKLGATTADVGPDDKVAILGGADLKYQMVKQSTGIPVDMAIDLGFNTHVISSKNISEVTFSTIFSRPYPLTDRGYKVTPYCGIELSVLYGSYFSKNETDYYVFGGVEWKLSQKSMLYAELKAGGHTLGGIGIRFEY